MTRPRQPFSPALAGAVDLSSLARPAAPAGAATHAARGVAVTEANFESEVITRSQSVPVIVVLWSPRSESSAVLVDTFAALADTDGGRWSLVTVDVDSSPQLGQVFGVQAVPTVIALAAGQPIGSFQGGQPAEQLRRWVDSVLQATAGTLAGEADGDVEQVDPKLAAARGLLDRGDLDTARTAYEGLLAKDPTHAEAKGAVRQIDFLLRAGAHPDDAIARADAAPTDVAAALAAADVEILSQLVDEAFARLLALVRRTAGEDRTAARTRLIELFDLFDPADPGVIAARRGLANALY